MRLVSPVVKAFNTVASWREQREIYGTGYKGVADSQHIIAVNYCCNMTTVRESYL